MEVKAALLSDVILKVSKLSLTTCILNLGSLNLVPRGPLSTFRKSISRGRERTLGTRLGKPVIRYNLKKLTGKFQPYKPATGSN